MRVFVLCTGRCGSTTFSKACGHIRNFTVAHEGRKLPYPDQHIEVDNRLSWRLGWLADGPWTDSDTVFVHLSRDPEAVARSFEKRKGYGIMRAYRRTIWPGGNERDMIGVVEANIRDFLRNGNRKNVPVQLKNPRPGFRKMWDLIGAEGNFEEAMKEFQIRYNRS